MEEKFYDKRKLESFSSSSKNDEKAEEDERSSSSKIHLVRRKLSNPIVSEKGKVYSDDEEKIEEDLLKQGKIEHHRNRKLLNQTFSSFDEGKESLQREDSTKSIDHFQRLQLKVELDGGSSSSRMDPSIRKTKSEDEQFNREILARKIRKNPSSRSTTHELYPNRHNIHTCPKSKQEFNVIKNINKFSNEINGKSLNNQKVNEMFKPTVHPTNKKKICTCGLEKGKSVLTLEDQIERKILKQNFLQFQQEHEKRKIQNPRSNSKSPSPNLALKQIPKMTKSSGASTSPPNRKVLVPLPNGLSSSTGRLIGSSCSSIVSPYSWRSEVNDIKEIDSSNVARKSKLANNTTEKGKNKERRGINPSLSRKVVESDSKNKIDTDPVSLDSLELSSNPKLRNIKPLIARKSQQDPRISKLSGRSSSEEKAVIGERRIGGSGRGFGGSSSTKDPLNLSFYRHCRTNSFGFSMDRKLKGPIQNLPPRERRHRKVGYAIIIFSSLLFMLAILCIIISLHFSSSISASVSILQITNETDEEMTRKLSKYIPLNGYLSNESFLPSMRKENEDLLRSIVQTSATINSTQASSSSGIASNNSLSPVNTTPFTTQASSQIQRSSSNQHKNNNLNNPNIISISNLQLQKHRTGTINNRRFPTTVRSPYMDKSNVHEDEEFEIVDENPPSNLGLIDSSTIIESIVKNQPSNMYNNKNSIVTNVGKSNLNS